MKFQLNASDLRTIMDICKLAVDKKGSREVLTMIHCKLEKDGLVAESLDGYRLHQVTVPCEVIESEATEFLLPVVKVPAKSKVVIIEVINDEVIFDFVTEKQAYKVPSGEYPDVSNVIPQDKPQFEIAFNPKFLKEAAEAFKNDEYIVLQFYDEMKPMIVKPNKAEGTFAMVIPIRRAKKS